MAQVFHFTKDQAGLHSSFGELQRRLKDASKQKGIESSIANALWSQEGHAFVPGFLYLDEEDPRLTAAEIAALFSLAHNAQAYGVIEKVLLRRSIRWLRTLPSIASSRKSCT